MYFRKGGILGWEYNCACVRVDTAIIIDLHKPAASEHSFQIRPAPSSMIFFWRAGCGFSADVRRVGGDGRSRWGSAASPGSRGGSRPPPGEHRVTANARENTGLVLCLRISNFRFFPCITTGSFFVLDNITKAEFLSVLGTKVFRVFLLSIHSPSTNSPPPPPEQKWFETGLWC